MQLGFGVSLTRGGGKAKPLIITALVAPSLGPLAVGDTIQSAYTAGVFASAAGVIVSATPTYLLDGVPVAGSTAVAAGQVAQVVVLVTDSVGTTRVFATAARTAAPPLIAWVIEDGVVLSMPVPPPPFVNTGAAGNPILEYA